MGGSVVVDSSDVVEGIIAIFIIFLLLSALYSPLDTSAENFKNALQNSTNTYVRTYVAPLVDYVPFLFLLSILVGLIVRYAKKMKGE